jgi:two-component system, sensor histidine kinase PdtaS
MDNIKTLNSEKRIQLLLHIGEVLNSSLDYHKNLADITHLMTPALADWCAIDILDENGDLQRLAVSHVDPEKIKYAYELQEKYPPEKNYDTGSYKVIATGESDFYPDIPEELLKNAAKDEEHYRILKELGFRSAISVPLKTAGKIFGVLTLITTETEYNYTKEDLVFVEELARRAGVAIEHSRLYTEARNLSYQMESQNERLDNILKTVPAIVWEMWYNRASGRKNFISHYFEKLLGYKVEEWFADPEFMFRIVHPDDVERLRKETDKISKGDRKEGSIQFRLIKKDGMIIWVESTRSVIVDFTGTPIGMRGVTVDISQRKKVEERLKAVVESSPNALVMVNNRGVITLVNTQAEKLLGYSREELIGKPVEEIVPARFRTGHADYKKDFMKNPQARPMGAGRDLFARRKDGSEVPVEIGLSPVRTEEGLFVLSSIVDISERRKIEKKIEASLNEKDILLKEIHHRVKNNLQIISSLLSLQSNFLQDPNVVDALTESQNRIRSMALIHEKLYQTMDLSRINFREYIEDLVDNLFNSYQADSNVTKEILVDEVYLNIDIAISLGLIINELVTNSFKYAFPDKKGKVLIRMYRNGGDGEVKLEVEDNGTGLPADFNISSTNTLGFQLVLSLIDQIEGEIKTIPVKGTKFVITYKDSGTPKKS